MISRTRGPFFFSAPTTDKEMLMTTCRIQELRLCAYLSGNIMPPTPLPLEMVSLDVAPARVTHPFYARDSAATAYASASVEPGSPDSYMSITASPKFNKHSFEVYLSVFGLFYADTLILHFCTLGATNSVPSGWQGANLKRSFNAWVATGAHRPTPPWTPTWRHCLDSKSCTFFSSLTVVLHHLPYTIISSYLYRRRTFKFLFWVILSQEDRRSLKYNV